MTMTRERRRRALLTKLGLIVAGLGVGLVLAEMLSLLLLPIRATPLIDGEGREIGIGDDNLRLRPNVRVRQVTREFDVFYTTTALGHRVPAVSGSPEMVFIGDSMTFGVGVNDEETFVFRLCTENKISCANLGRPGTGTRQQVDVLEAFLRQEGWRPRRVRLMMFAMTGSLMAGNDLADNLLLARNMQTADTNPFSSKSLLSNAIARFRYVMQELNLTRVVMLYAGPLLRSWLTPRAEAALVAEALKVTGAELNRLDTLACEYGFVYDLTIIHPVQDFLRGTHPETLRAIRRVAHPGVAVRSTDEVFRREPARSYYPRDMHLNRVGHQAVANFLASSDPLAPLPTKEKIASPCQ